MMNLVPAPISLSKVTVPPIASVMRLTTAKPKPCPLDFVVNNGVKSLGLASSGIPIPVSWTEVTGKTTSSGARSREVKYKEYFIEIG